MDNLEKIDIIMARFDVGYEEAREVLAKNCGDLVAALVELEKRSACEGSFERKTRRVKDDLREAWDKSKATKIRFKKDGRTLLSVPVPLGAIGLVGMLSSGVLATAGVAGAVLAMAKKVTVDIEKPRD